MQPQSLDSGLSDNVVSNGDALYASLCEDEVTAIGQAIHSNCCNAVMSNGIGLHTCAHTNLEVSKNELKLINIYDAARSC